METVPLSSQAIFSVLRQINVLKSQQTAKMDMITVVTVLTVLLDGLIVVILRPVLLFQAVVALMTTVEIAYH